MIELTAIAALLALGLAVCAAFAVCWFLVKLVFKIVLFPIALLFGALKIGLVLINVNMTDITDESGYIEAIGRKAAAEAVQSAEIDVAEQEKRGAIGWIVFDHEARRNAISVAMWKGIPDAVREMEEDDAIRVVVMRGAGEDAFVAGADISDATYLLNHLFLGGAAPVAPFPECGPGMLPPDQACATSPTCG